jgi:excisionase family DNA binding protein
VGSDGYHRSDGDTRLFLNASEVGEQLGLRKSRVYALAAEGLLPTVRLGRRILFPRRGLDALAEQAIERARERALRWDRWP